MRTLIRYLAYPLTIGSSVAAVLAVLTTTAPWFAMGIVSIVGIAIVVGLERLLPFRIAWVANHGDLGADTIHAIVNWTLLSVAAWGLHAIGQSPLALWPANWPVWLQLILAGAIFDLGLYLMHRASHRLRWLWRLHAIHHSSERLYWLNGERRHPFSALALATPGIVAVTALGVPPAVTSAWLAVLAIHLAFQHANLDYRLGPLRYVLAGAETHRQHHRRDYAGLQVNFGEFFLFWDILFGTFDNAEFREDEQVGLDDEAIPANYLAQMQWPFGAREVPSSYRCPALPSPPSDSATGACAKTVAAS